jgi:hypothetical protein
MSAPAATQQTQLTPIQLTNLQFLQNTRPKRNVVTLNSNYLDGGITKNNLQQAGLADKLILYITASIVVAGTVTGGTFNGFGQGWPAPYSILKNFQFYSNNNLIMRNLSGWSLYKWARKRYNTDPTKCTAINYSANTLAALGLNQGSGAIVAGANVAAGTYTWNIAIPIDLAYNQQAEFGMLSLQNNNIIYTAQATWGQISGGIIATGGSNDLFNGLTGTGLSVTPTITYSIGVDVWDYPNFQPFQSGGKWYVNSVSKLMSSFMGVMENIQTPLVAGTNTYRPPQNDIYTQIGLEFINNGTPVAVANLQNPTIQYASNVYPYVESYGVQLGRSYFEDQIPVCDGNIWYDFGMRRGLRLHRDTLDGFNDQSITNLQMNVTLPGTLSITGTNQINVVQEYLNSFQQS